VAINYRCVPLRCTADCTCDSVASLFSHTFVKFAQAFPLNSTLSTITYLSVNLEVVLQLEESLAKHVKWSVGIKSVLHAGNSEFQSYELVDSHPFGKVLTSLQP
jgi:hypothetical protein